MKKYLTFTVLAILGVLLFIKNEVSVHAEEGARRELTFAVGFDEPIAADRIVYTTLQRMGIGVSITALGMDSAIQGTNNGVYDGLCSQASGLEEDYPFLVRVPEMVSTNRYYAYALAGTELQCSGWEDLKGLRVGTLYEKTYTKANLPQTIAGHVEKRNWGDLLGALNNKECDVVIASSRLSTESVMPDNVVNIGLLDTVPSYMYLNKRNEELIPQMAEVIKDMREDGTLDELLQSRSVNTSHVKTVLFISSYSSEMERERRVLQGITGVFDQNKEISYYSVNLNAKRIQNEDSRDKIALNLIRMTICGKQPDAIIASDNEALEFVSDYYNVLFTGIPIVFCGINTYSPSMLNGISKNITGLADTISAEKLADEMLALFPETKEIYLINDYSESGQMWREQLLHQLSFLKDKVKVVCNEDLPVNDLLDQVAALNKDTLILCGSYYLDANSHCFTEAEFQAKLAAEAKVPIFGVFECTKGYGQLGGLYSSGYFQGESAAKIVMKILEGENASDIPVATDTTASNHWTFDGKVMEHYKVKEFSLPAGSEIINVEPSFRESNPVLFTIILSGIIFSVTIISLLTVFAFSLRQRNRNLRTAQAQLVLAEERTKTAYSEIQKVIETVPVAIAVADPVEEKTLLYNQALCDLFGFSSLDEILHNKIIKMYHNNPSGKMDEVLRSNRKMYWKSKITLDSGEEKELILYMKKITFYGKDCIVIAHKDVTMESLQEIKLKNAANKEKEANRLKSHFIMNMNHEIKTPMNAIVGITNIAKGTQDVEKLAECMEQIESATRHLKGIVDDVLDYAQIEDGNLVLKPEEAGLRETIGSIVEMFQGEAKKQQVSIEIDLEKITHNNVLVDGSRLGQVVMNLLSNGIKFSKAEGHVVISVEEELHKDGKSTYVFKIKDDGIGIEESKLSRLFKPFEQSDDSITRKYGGAGLGLVISKDIVRLMNGEIGVESVFGEGTTFTFTICVPVVKDKEEAELKNLELDAPLDFSTMRVLVVDDVQINRMIAGKLFESQGFSIDEAENGEEAVNKLKDAAEGDYDLILMDIQMPVMDGCTATKEIRKLPESWKANIPIIAISAYAAPDGEDLSRDAGIDAFVEKPFDLKSVLELVERIIRERRNHC